MAVTQFEKADTASFPMDKADQKQKNDNGEKKGRRDGKPDYWEGRNKIRDVNVKERSKEKRGLFTQNGRKQRNKGTGQTRVGKNPESVTRKRSVAQKKLHRR